jgi:hypothetical protein
VAGCTSRGYRPRTQPDPTHALRTPAGGPLDSIRPRNEQSCAKATHYRFLSNSRSRGSGLPRISLARVRKTTEEMAASSRAPFGVPDPAASRVPAADALTARLRERPTCSRHHAIKRSRVPAAVTGNWWFLGTGLHLVLVTGHFWRWPFATLSMQSLRRSLGNLPRRAELVHLWLPAPGGGIATCPNGQLTRRDFHPLDCSLVGCSSLAAARAARPRPRDPGSLDATRPSRSGAPGQSKSKTRSNWHAAG